MTNHQGANAAPFAEERNVDEETLLERFEAWHIEEHGWFDMKARVCAERWAGFKAHAECCPVVVELPTRLDVTPGGGLRTHLRGDLLEYCDTVAAIQAAGGMVAR